MEKKKTRQLKQNKPKMVFIIYELYLWGLYFENHKLYLTFCVNCSSFWYRNQMQPVRQILSLTWLVHLKLWRVSYLPLLFLFISKTELNVFYSHMREGTYESTYNHRRFLLAKHKNPVLLFFFFKYWNYFSRSKRPIGKRKGNKPHYLDSIFTIYMINKDT